MREYLARVFGNLPIERKLLLTSIIPLTALILLSAVTYRHVQVFSDDEEHLHRIYQVQKMSAEYVRLLVDLETGFRGYVLTREESYLDPYRTVPERVAEVGKILEVSVRDEPPSLTLVLEVQQSVNQLISEKKALIRGMKSGHREAALRYIEEGHGQALMSRIRQGMSRFDYLEQEMLLSRLTSLSQDRTSLLYVVLWGGTLTLGLMMLTLHLIARSITGPLTSLARAVGASPLGTVPSVPVIERQDEIGHLTRGMHAMSVQIQDHLSKLEKSESELRVVNQDLSSSESKYRSLVDHAPFGIFTTKGMVVTFSNRYNQFLAGLNPDELMDPASFRTWIHPEDRQRVLSEYAQAVEQGRPYETMFRFLHQDGGVRKVLSRRMPIKDADGQIRMYQGFNIDITALDQLQERLSRAERLATLGQMAAGIAHEIRNPLVGIGSTASLLLEDTPDSDPRKADLGVILAETKRLDRIVNQIIDYARPREVAPIEFALADLIAETLRLLDAAVTAKHVGVCSMVPPSLPPIHADRDQLKQVLLNLFQNAIEALPDGGRLDITAGWLAQEGESGVVITVADIGCGIAPNDLGHVFEPFFTTGKYHGTGLGLALCRNIIEAHRGDIHLTSEVGQGTSVRVWIPFRQEPQMIED